MGTKWVRRDPPLAPVDVVVMRASASEIEIGWRPAPPKKQMGEEVPQKIDIHGYEVYYEVEGSKPKKRLLDGSSESLVVKNLKPGQLVKGISVKARNDAGWGPASQPEIQGRSTSAPPGQVDWIEVTEATAFTVTLQWSQPEESNGSEIDDYKVLQRVPGIDSSVVEFTTGSGECQHICFGLQPGTPYTFTVCAKNVSGWGPWVRLPTFTNTLSAPPNQPYDCKIVGTTVSTVEAAWRKPYSNGGDISAYEVVYEDDVGKLCTLLHMSALDTDKGIAAADQERFTIEGLHPGSLLVRVRVRAKNDAGWGAFSEPLFASTSGQLVSWGNDDGGQLGRGTEEEAVQLAVQNMRNKHVSVIAAGQFHAAAVCGGKCYTWGSNSSGQLGRYAGSGDPVPEEVNVAGYMSQHSGSAVEAINDTLHKNPNLKVLTQKGPSDYLGSMGQEARTQGSVTSVAVGRAHTMILTSLGEIFSFGDASMGVLGHGMDEHLNLPKMIDSLSVPGLVVTDIFCGERHSACIVLGGQALTWGCGLEGQLGHSSYDNVTYPRKVEHLRAFRVVTLACGDTHSAFVTEGGDMYTCGAGRDGKLGHGSDKTFLYPKKIEALSGVVTVSCGHFHTACITSDRSLYTWGSGSNGQLGHPHRRVEDQRIFSTLGVTPQAPWQQQTPRCVTSLAANTEAGGALLVECGILCTLAVSADYSLWMWGTGPPIEAVAEDKARPPQTPERITRFGTDFICQLSCGSTFALALLAKFPPGAEERREEADKVEREDTNNTKEVIATTVQEACFWGAKIGYPVLMGATEHTTRLYLDGVRGEEVDREVELCYSEVRLRQAFKQMFRKEEQRLSKVDATPKLMIVGLEQTDAQMTDEEREQRDKALEELKEQRAQQAIKDQVRKAGIEKMQADREEMERAESKEQ